jgi:hypothetical protein
MREMKTIGESPFGKRYSIWDYGQSQKQVNLWRDKWSKALQQQAREAEGEEKGMQRGGRVIPLQPGTSGHIRRAALAEQGYTYDPNTNSMQEPETTIAAGAAETPTYDPYYGAGNYANAWNLGSMPWRNWENYQPDGEGGYTFEPPEDWYDPGGGGPGGPGAAPPRIAPTDPASYVGASADVSGRESPYREQLREHQSKIKEILGTGSARGGPVRGYQEGGTARADNPFDPVAQKYQWRSWERKHGRDPDEPEVVAPPAPEEAPPPPEDEGGFAAWLRSFFIPDPETENVEAVEEYMESIDQARGGRVNYQTGGLAQVNRPRGGVPPWVEPVEQGYQFGGRATGMMAPRMARRAMQQYRGVPPQRAPIQPRGGLFAALQRGQRGDPRLRVTGRTSRTLPPGIDPRAVAANPQGYAQWAADPRSAGARGILPGEMRGPMGPINIVDPTTGESTPYWGPGGREGYDERVRRMQRGPMAPGGGPLQLPAPGGGPLQLPIMNRPSPNVGRPGYDQIGDMGPITPGGGNIPPWKRLPGQRRQVPPSPGRAYPGGPGGPVPGGEQLPMGGARVPPNQQGYLQRMRMMNRPPSGPVGGGANRVGMRDQQGALSRAMQRGTGRPPMSRRYAFGRGAQQP